jgi:hypothetical protein
MSLIGPLRRSFGVYGSFQAKQTKDIWAAPAPGRGGPMRAGGSASARATPSCGVRKVAVPTEGTGGDWDRLPSRKTWESVSHVTPLTPSRFDLNQSRRRAIIANWSHASSNQSLAITTRPPRMKKAGGHVGTRCAVEGTAGHSCKVRSAKTGFPPGLSMTNQNCLRLTPIWRWSGTPGTGLKRLSTRSVRRIVGRFRI